MAAFSRSSDVRPPVLAGSWYPGSTDKLKATIDRYITHAPPIELPGNVVALIAPHAGYEYSGQVAAHAYAQVSGAAYRTIVLVGPAHRAMVGDFATPAYHYLQTPLGRSEVDAELVEALAKRVKLARVTIEEDGGDNSLEIHLPFLQSALEGATVLPIMMGYPLAPRFGREGLASCRALGVALAEILAGRKDVLLVASTDLSHLPAYDDVVRYDRVFTELVAQFDAESLAEALVSGRCHACGGAPVVAVMMAAQKLGADKATVLAYANSGDVTGERIGRPYIVGYTAVAITRPAES